MREIIIIVVVALVLLSTALSPEGLWAQGLSRDSKQLSLAPDERSGREQFRFIGVPEEHWYFSFDPEKPPPPPEEFDPRPFLLVNVVKVVSGHPPVDDEGNYHHVGLDLLVVGGAYPVPGLMYEFSGYRRKDPSSGVVFYKEEECRALWGRWLALLALYAALIVMAVLVLHRSGVLLARRLRRPGRVGPGTGAETQQGQRDRQRR